jgi:hypothetical protein
MKELSSDMQMALSWSDCLTLTVSLATLITTLLIGLVTYKLSLAQLRLSRVIVQPKVCMQVDTSNRKKICISLENQGSGPAFIDSLVMVFASPLHSIPDELLCEYSIKSRGPGLRTVIELQPGYTAQPKVNGVFSNQNRDHYLFPELYQYDRQYPDHRIHIKQNTLPAVIAPGMEARAVLLDADVTGAPNADDVNSAEYKVFAKIRNAFKDSVLQLYFRDSLGEKCPPMIVNFGPLMV